MTIDTTHSNSVEENSPWQSAPAGHGAVSLLRDHAWRSLTALAGLRVYGAAWLGPWATYCVSPVLHRVAPDGFARFDGFNARLGACDLYTFANVFADYPVDRLRQDLSDVELIVDLGANVGAFSFLMHTLCHHCGSFARIIAVEPDPDNITFLRMQPFADSIEIHHGAAGPLDGTAKLVAGRNSVTHQVDFSGTAEGETIPVISLEALCSRPALVKMDIEGGELEILEHGLPENVRRMVLEWHHPGEPNDLVEGNWEKISTDMDGATTWYFSR